MNVARFLTQQIALNGASQRAIAVACGYSNSNIVTMFKKGSTKLPLNKVAQMARALDVDPGYLLRLVMTEYEPETWAVIVGVLGTRVSVTDAEASLLEFVRTEGNGRTPCVDVHENRSDLAAAIRCAVERDEARDDAAVASVPRQRPNVLDQSSGVDRESSNLSKGVRCSTSNGDETAINHLVEPPEVDSVTTKTAGAPSSRSPACKNLIRGPVLAISKYPMRKLVKAGSAIRYKMN